MPLLALEGSCMFKFDALKLRQPHLNGGAHGDNLIGVDASARRLAEHLLHHAFDLRMCGMSDPCRQHCLV